MKPAPKAVPAVFFLFVFVCFPSLAQAFDGKPIDWLCWYNGDSSIRCLPKAKAVERAVSAVGAEQRQVDPRLPAVVSRIWNHPESLQNNDVIIPLHGEPYDMAFTQLLAKSVVCGTNRNCTADFFPSRGAPGFALALAEALDASDVPALADAR